MNRKAVLIFANPIGLDLGRRGLPNALRPLLDLRGVCEGVAADFHLFTSGVASAIPGVVLHRQRGRSFAERLERATDEIAALGYDEIVVIGRDCPSLAAGDITRAFAGLNSNRMVLGPDHRGGCYLIALHARERHLLRGIRWRKNTDCAQLQACADGDSALLTVKHDIDSWRDLSLLTRLADRLGRLVAFLLAQTSLLSTAAATFPLGRAWQADRARRQMPPPALFA